LAHLQDKENHAVRVDPEEIEALNAAASLPRDFSEEFEEFVGMVRNEDHQIPLQTVSAALNLYIFLLGKINDHT